MRMEPPAIGSGVALIHRWVRPRTVVPGSVPRILALLLAFIAVPVLLVQGAIYFDRYETRRGAEYQANLEIARAVAATFQAFVDDVLHQELAVGHFLAMADDRLTLDEANQMLDISARAYPAVDFYSWLDPDGRVVASSQSDAVGMEFGDRAYVQEIVQGRPWAVSDLLPGRLTDGPVFVVARAIRDPQGRLDGIVAASIDPRRLGVVLTIPRDADGAVAIIDRQGRGVYRYPEVAWTWEQRDWASTQPLVAEALGHGEVVGEFASVLDREVRLAGLAPISSIGWLASANRPREQAMAPVRDRNFRDFTLLAVVLLAAALAAAHISRHLTAPLRRLQEQALALGRGESPPPLDIDRPTEFRQLAAALRHMAAELRARDAQREELLAILSHDLRNPLTSIRGQAQLARRRLARDLPPDRESLLTSLVGIEDAAARANGIIEQLRDPGFLAGQEPIELRPETFDLVALVRAAVEAQQQLSEQHRLQFEAIESELVGLWDRGALQRVVDNLLSNAIKYSPPGSWVTVAIRREGDDAVLSISDEGVGIPAADLPFVFLPHHRGRNVGSADGSGLGLASARRIVEQHGGAIAVDSRESQGSTFTVRLLLQRSHASSAPEQPPSLRASSS